MSANGTPSNNTSYGREVSCPSPLAHTTNPGNPYGYPEAPVEPVKAPPSPSNAVNYHVPEGHPLPCKGWWASVEDGQVAIHGTETVGRLPQVSHWGVLGGLEVGDELLVPYTTLEGLLRVLSWAVTPRDLPGDPEGDQALDLWVAWARGVVSPPAKGLGRDGSVTAQGLREALEKAGIEGQALDLVLKRTARHRHDWRVRQTLEAVAGLPPGGALAALLADSIGGLGTERHPLFRGLGKGRRWASDGPAWMAAAREAYCRISGGMPNGRLVIEATPLGEVVARQGDDAATVAEPWASLALARAGLLASLGLPYLPEGEDVTWAGFTFEGAAPNWGLAVNLAERAYAKTEEATASW